MLTEFKSWITVQQKFIEKYGHVTSDKHIIVQWQKQLLRNFQRQEGRSSTLDNQVEAIHEALIQSLGKYFRKIIEIK